MDDIIVCSGQILKNERARKSTKANHSLEQLTFSGNFTSSKRIFDISPVNRRVSMKRDILNTVLKRTESRMREENPYEDPKDVIVPEKPPKPPRKRTIHAIAVSSPRNKESKSLLKEQKRKLAKKYEGLIMTLMEKCEENVVLISEKESQVTKLKDKLKSVLEYNKLFAEENDQLKEQYTTLVKYVEDCKKALKDERERNRELELKKKELEDRTKQFDVPERDYPEIPTTVPLVEVCMKCSSRQILFNQAKEQNARLQKDMLALKDVLYRLNVQLSRYQEKLRKCQCIEQQVHKTDKLECYDSLITASLSFKPHDAREIEESVSQTQSTKSVTDEQTKAKVVDLSGLLSAQALAPLFDAYQENLQEKENLILDYEKQFEIINKKSKQIVEDNKSLTEKVNYLEEELVQVRQSYKKLVVDRETTDIERATLLERAERAELKLKEVYELYEDKISMMLRDHETLHQQYISVRGALGSRTRTVPADLHERRLDHCKRLLEELKHQYGMENERKTEKMSKLEAEFNILDEKYTNLCKEHEAVKQELSKALKNVRLYRKAAVIFRQRLKASAARVNRVRRSARLSRHSAEPLRVALERLEKIKLEIKAVKSRAYTSLEQLERRIVHQERSAAQALAALRRELGRAEAALQHKDDIIRRLIDNVADIEEVRLSQTNAHRLQGIVSDSSDKSDTNGDPNKEPKTSVKLVQGSGGYYQEKELKRGK